MRRHPTNTPSLLKHFGDDVSRVVAFTTTNTATIKEIFLLSFFISSGHHFRHREVMYYSWQLPSIYITQGCSEVGLRLRIKFREFLDPSENLNKI
jgi:hypothetical protein